MFNFQLPIPYTPTPTIPYTPYVLKVLALTKIYNDLAVKKKKKRNKEFWSDFDDGDVKMH